MFAGYVPLAISEPLHCSLFFWPIIDSHLSHPLENVIFAKSRSIYASTLSMWFQGAECNAVNASLLLDLINNNFRESPHFESSLTPKIRKSATPF